MDTIHHPKGSIFALAGGVKLERYRHGAIRSQSSMIYETFNRESSRVRHMFGIARRPAVSPACFPVGPLGAPTIRAVADSRATSLLRRFRWTISQCLPGGGDDCVT